jgi:hypothetical protein
MQPLEAVVEVAVTARVVDWVILPLVDVEV